MCPEATLGELNAINLVLVISYEPVKVESESRNFSQEQRKDGKKKESSGFPVPIFLPKRINKGTSPFSLMGNPTVHEESFKNKYKLS